MTTHGLLEVEKNQTHSLLIGKQAPSFYAQAVKDGEVLEHFSLDDFQGRYVVFFFYPLDFTFVCPTELHEFQNQLEAFESRNAQVVGCSVDSVYSHLAWMNTPKVKGGIEGVKYPIVSDMNKRISKKYHVLDEEQGIAFRGLFVINQQGIIRHQLVNDLPIGRSIPEVIRILDALIFHEKNGDVCPANWNNDQPAMTPSISGRNAYFEV